MKITVNGEGREVQAQTLRDALAELGLADAIVATALNRDFVPAAARGETALAEGDAIEIVAPMQGG
jgi:sulfur carrier protein